PHRAPPRPPPHTSPPTPHPPPPPPPRQIADVPDARLHDVVRAEIARDGAGLRRRLDDREWLGHVRNPRCIGYEGANRGKSALPWCHERGVRVKHSRRRDDGIPCVALPPDHLQVP